MERPIAAGACVSAAVASALAWDLEGIRRWKNFCLN